VHDYLALFFALGLAVMLLKWFKHNIFEAHDRQWFSRLAATWTEAIPRGLRQRR